MKKIKTFKLLCTFTLFTLTWSKPSFCQSFLKASVAKELKTLVEKSLKRSPLIQKVFFDNETGIHDAARINSRLYPSLSASFSYEDSTDPSVLATDTGGVQDLIKNSFMTWNLKLSQELPSSTEIFVEFTNQRIDTNSQNVLVTPYYFSQLRIGGSQDLIQDFDWFNLGLSGLWLERQRDQAKKFQAKAQTVQELTENISAIEKAYWNLVETKEILKARKSVLSVAQNQLDVTLRKISAGILVEAEKFSFEDSVSQRKAELHNAGLLVNTRVQELVRITGLLDLASDFPRARFSDVEVLSPLSLVDLENDQELARNPEILVRGKKVKSLGLAKNLARSKILPSLDLTGAFFLNGGNSTAQQGFGNNLDILLDSDTTGFDVSAELVIPLGPSGELAEYRRSVAEYRAAEAGFLYTKIKLQTDLKEKSETLKHRYAILNARLDSVRLAKKRLDFEQRKYERGLTPAFATLQYIENLSESKVNSIKAMKDYLTTQIDLEALLGRTLEKYQIQIVESDGRWNFERLQ